MSEVTELYESVGIGKRMTCFFECSRKTCSVDCEHFEKLDMSYPPFTPEKQLELIKWLGIRDAFNFYQNKVTKDWVFYDHEKDATHYNFELGLASWIDYLWQGLTTEEKQQIKEILE